MLWCGTLGSWWAKGGRHRRCATEETSQASGITRTRPWRRPGVVTNPDATTTRGSVRQRTPPSTRDGRVSAALTAGAPQALAPLVVPLTTQAGAVSGGRCGPRVDGRARRRRRPGETARPWPRR